MMLTVHDMDIDCPDVPQMVELVKKMGSTQARNLRNFQKQEKKWAGQTDIPEYCLYLGSMESDDKYDLYHYEAGGLYPHYSTAIVFGDKGGDYMSGWAELAAKDNRDHYKELMRREYLCGLLTVDDLMCLGISVLSSGRGHSEEDVIRPMRDSFKLERPDNIEREWLEPTFEFYYEVEGVG